MKITLQHKLKRNKKAKNAILAMCGQGDEVRIAKTAKSYLVCGQGDEVRIAKTAKSYLVCALGDKVGIAKSANFDSVSEVINKVRAELVKHSPLANIPDLSAWIGPDP